MIYGRLIGSVGNYGAMRFTKDCVGNVGVSDVDGGAVSAWN